LNHYLKQRSVDDAAKLPYAPSGEPRRPRGRMAMRVTFLGTGTSTGVPVPTCSCSVCRSDDPRDHRLRASVLLQWAGASVLVDTSTDLRAQALRHGIERVDAVLYTHGHADHILGLDDLRVYKWRQEGPVPVYSSPHTLLALSRTFWYVFDDEATESTRPEIEPRPVHSSFSLLRRTVHPVPLMHGRLPILGYRLGRFAYLTDVSEIPESSHGLLRDLDVLVLNALRDRPHPTHLNLEAALVQAERIGARKTYLTHVSHEVRHASVSARLPAGVELAYDGLAFDVADDGEELP
jgi:phosphoribosyl 1,2-cyclic phosphate phosphodiesterase